MSDLFRLDAAALTLMGHEVLSLPADSHTASTPCKGWNVRNLVQHMNDQHEAVAAGALPSPSGLCGDPMADFPRHAARWLVALEQAGELVHVPMLGREVPVERVLAAHLVDMLVHRWDLLTALGRECDTPDELTRVALPIARSLTGPESPLSGPGGVYAPPLPEDPERSPIQNLVALLGRNPG